MWQPTKTMPPMVPSPKRGAGQAMRGKLKEMFLKELVKEIGLDRTLRLLQDVFDHKELYYAFYEGMTSIQFQDFLEEKQKEREERNARTRDSSSDTETT